MATKVHGEKRLPSHPGRPSKPDPSVEMLQCRWHGCMQVFATPQGARDHEYTHAALPSADDPASFVCKIMNCGKSMPDGKQLRKHMALHQPKAFECETCGKKFHEATKLRRHLIVHSGDKNFVCEECGKNFTFKANLKTHLRVHTGERPFNCTIDGCKRRFAQASNRNAHVLTHYKDGVLLPLDTSSQSSSPASDLADKANQLGEEDSPRANSEPGSGADTEIKGTVGRATKRKQTSAKAVIGRPASAGAATAPPPPPPMMLSEQGRRSSYPPLMFSSPLPKGAEELFMLSTPRLATPEPHVTKRPLENAETESNDRSKFPRMTSYGSAIAQTAFDPTTGTTSSDRGARAFQMYQGNGLLPSSATGMSAFRSLSPFMFSQAPMSLPSISNVAQSGTAQQQQHQGSPRLPSIAPSLQQQLSLSSGAPSVQSTPLAPLRTISGGGMSSSQSGGSMPPVSSVGSNNSGGADFDKTALFRLAQMSTDMLDRSTQSQTPKGLSITPPPFPAMPAPSSASQLFNLPGSGGNSSSSSSDRSLLFSSSFNSLSSSNPGRWSPPADDTRLMTPQIGLRLSPDSFNNPT